MEKAKKIYNATNASITVVTSLETVVIPAESYADVKVPEDAVFNAPDGSFYVEEEGDFYVKRENCSTGADMEIYVEVDVKTKNTGLWYRVIEDNGGGLALFILSGTDDNQKVVYGATGYEYRPSALTKDITAFMGGSSPVDEWEEQTDSTTGESIDAQEIYDNYDNHEYGWEIVAQGDFDTQKEIKWPQKMGAAAKTEFRIDDEE